ncbi:uncharacterized protein LOC110111697 [Dendrobium catenatum]|uniref:uncharacterized protein LOC110111697 n=1 Tax=Dendrobium catenatum TaxID=906689 RepID=UPI0010A075F8|nr:uncharacterized protein LOC110111697 [Dendrobium catenatum]
MHSSQDLRRQVPPADDGIWLIDDEGDPIKKRGRTTCADIQSMPPGTRVHIEVNENMVPCNIPESILLGSYLGVLARDPILAPISFSDWRNKGMELFKKRMLAEVEAKFEFLANIKHWILQSLGSKWRNYKSSLKAEHWDSRPLQEIMEAVPAGVDSVQWCQIVNKWSQPQDKSIRDRLLLWQINRKRKDGSWSSEAAREKWARASEMLAEEGLTPEDGNFEANEKVFKTIMGPEHPGRVRTQGFGVTPSRYFPHSTTTRGSSSGGNTAFDRVVRLEEVVQTLQSEVRQFMKNHQGQHPLPGSSTMTTGSFTVDLMDCLNPLKVKKFASASVPGETTKSEVISGYGRVDRVDMKAGANTGGSSFSWYLDSGTTTHLTPDIQSVR